jgi:hypothetical protein
LTDLAYHLTMGTACKPVVKDPTPLEVATAELIQTQHELLAESKLAEYHDKMVEMLLERLDRLRADIATLSDSQPEVRKIGPTT